MESKRGKPILQMGSYRFNQHGLYRKGGPKILWICVRWSAGCRASITTFNNDVIKLSTKSCILQSDMIFRSKESSVVTPVLMNDTTRAKCRTRPFKMQYLQAEVSRPKTNNLQTRVSLPHTQYLKSGVNIASSLSTSNVVFSTKSAKNKTPRRKKQFLKKVSSVSAVPPNDIFDSDLSTCSFDTVHDTEEATSQPDTQHVIGSKQLSNSSFDLVTTACNLPALLISSNVDSTTTSQCSDSQYPQSVQYLQSQVPQRESNNNLPLEVLACQEQYLKANDDASSTINKDNVVYATNNAITGAQNEEQFQKREYRRASTLATVLPSNIFDSNIFTCSFDDIMDSDCNTSQYTTQCLQAQEPQEKTYILTADTSTSGNAQYIKPDVDFSSLSTVSADESMNIECSTSQYTRQSLQVIPQEESYILSSETSRPRDAACINSGVEFTSLTTVTAVEPIKSECSTSQYTTQCLQSKVPREKNYIMTAKTPTSGSAHYVNSDVYTSTLNTVAADQSMEIESSTPQYTTHCLQAQASQEETYVLTTETSAPGSTQYVDPDIFTSTLNTITANQPIKIECSTPQYTTQCLEAQIPQEETYVLNTETSTSGSAQYVHPDVFTSTLNSIIADQPMNIEYSTPEFTTQILQAQVPQEETYVLTADTITSLSSNDAGQSASKKTAFATPLPPRKRNKKKKPAVMVNSEHSTSQFTTQCLQLQVPQKKAYVLTTETSKSESPQYMKPGDFSSTTDTVTVDKPKKIECDRSSQKSSPSWRSPGVSDDIAQITIQKSSFATPLPPRIKSKKKPAIVNTGLKFEFLRSPRGKKALILNGIAYRMISAGLDKVRWRCSTHERFGCKAIVHTLEKHIIYMTDDHITSYKKRDCKT